VVFFKKYLLLIDVYLIEIIMKQTMPSAPSRFVWIIGLILGIIGIIGHFVTVDFLSTNNYWFLLAGFVLLALGTTFKEI